MSASKSSSTTPVKSSPLKTSITSPFITKSTPKKKAAGKSLGKRLFVKSLTDSNDFFTIFEDDKYYREVTFEEKENVKHRPISISHSTIKPTKLHLSEKIATERRALRELNIEKFGYDTEKNKL